MFTNILIVAMLTQAAIEAGSVDEPRISFSFVHETLVVIPVLLNGHGPYRFLLDTGATHSIVSRELANQLNIPLGRTGSLITAGGDVPVTVRTIEIVQIGGIRIMQAQIAVAEFDLLRNLNVDGVVGADYLKQFRISIDYAHKLLSISH